VVDARAGHGITFDPQEKSGFRMQHQVFAQIQTLIDVIGCGRGKAGCGFAGAYGQQQSLRCRGEGKRDTQGGMVRIGLDCGGGSMEWLHDTVIIYSIRMLITVFAKTQK
jgi:hypothetical protein